MAKFFTQQQLYKLRNDIPLADVLTILGWPHKTRDGRVCFVCPQCGESLTGWTESAWPFTPSAASAMASLDVRPWDDRVSHGASALGQQSVRATREHFTQQGEERAIPLHDLFSSG